MIDKEKSIKFHKKMILKHQKMIEKRLERIKQLTPVVFQTRESLRKPDEIPRKRDN